ncbi:MAG: hypothetical protein M5U31_06070 [Acidimicrobiia bacterium]|nr:hypothetical protein [Acidimicrobiia bacterium]
MSKSRVAIGWVGGCLLGLLGAFALFVIFMMMAMNSWANNK